MPIHRTISTVATRQFLKNLCQDSRIPEDIQLKALQLLEHFPTAQDVLTIARRENYLQETVGISQTLFALGAGKDGEVLQALILADEEQL
ncbi:BPSL0761 family protein [Pseudomonas putida]|uniref:BPSL0761 family protein n=1 Tax=Pseudomonas putida TaxID=303 RepID=UPI00034EDDB0|nr:BPSL0761 family protein [Pseudomonas putida]QPN42775.1 hypothetical protein I5S86_14395 [Priestia aryabhattai]AGN82596.1 hypothetical protein L483_17090 [Pseudomonas putida H8234]MDD2007016.1 hypothetical protein [Pseudomonas putida]HDS1809495.1 hypothetical protein [Pseudomonas putida]HDS3807606.1 hypothetical protein [Pseudomonas putida]